MPVVAGACRCAVSDGRHGPKPQFTKPDNLPGAFLDVTAHRSSINEAGMIWFELDVPNGGHEASDCRAYLVLTFNNSGRRLLVAVFILKVVVRWDD